MANFGSLLIVDDDVDFLAEASDCLSLAGFKPEASTGQPSESQLSGVSGAVLDLNLDESDGFTLLERIARLRTDLDVLVVSGQGDDLIRSAVAYALSLGFASVASASKPLGSDVLLDWYRGTEAGHGSRRAGLAQASSAATHGAAMLSAAEITALVESDALVAVFQPQFSTADQCCVGAEVLVRLQHPTRGLLPPAAFLPAILAADLGLRLFDKMLSAACDLLAALGLPPDITFKIAVNLSPDLLLANSEWLLERLAAPAIPRDRIVLEIPESLVMAGAQHEVRALAGLRMLGYRLAIDDFGCEYANLDRLLSFPVSEIKLDRSIIERAVRWESGREFLQSLAGMCASLGLATVVEGIETREMLALARSAGFDVVQGYLLGRPLESVEFASLMVSELCLPGAPVT